MALPVSVGRQARNLTRALQAYSRRADRFGRRRPMKSAMSDALLAAIQAGDEQKCVFLLNGLDETTRRVLYPSVAKALEETDAAFKSDYGSPRQQIFQRNTAARLAMLGTAAPGELKKTAHYRLPSEAAPTTHAKRHASWLTESDEVQLMITTPTRIAT